jgi:hypothetical protein
MPTSHPTPPPSKVPSPVPSFQPTSQVANGSSLKNITKKKECILRGILFQNQAIKENITKYA